MLAIPRRTINLYQGELEDIIKVFLSDRAIIGQEVREFEKAFAEFLGVKEAIAVNSGRFALKIILETLELPPGSEIIVPAYTAAEVPQIISLLGFNPVFVDIRNTDHNIDATLIEENITAITKAIIATHIFGIPCDIEKISVIAQKHHLFLIEDCAHSLGASYKKKKVGNFGIVSFFSFANSKPFNTFGGGAIATNDNQLAGKLKRKIENLPVMPKTKLIKSIFISYFLYILTKPLIFSLFVYPFILLNSLFKKDVFPKLYSVTFKKLLKPPKEYCKFSNLQAIIGLKQLKFYGDYCFQIKNKVKILSSKLLAAQYLNSDDKDTTTVPYFFVIVCKDVDKLSRYLLRKGIDTGKELMRYCPAYFDCAHDFPVAKAALEQSIQIPLNKYVNAMKALYMARLINRLAIDC